MNAFWVKYKSTILLVAGLVAGGLLGVFLPEATRFVKPVGDVFINMLFVLVVPLVFFSVSISFCRLKNGGGLGMMLKRMVMAFSILWVGGGILGYLGVLAVNPAGGSMGSMTEGILLTEPKNWGDTVTGALTVGDFPQLFSKFSLLPLIIFSALLGTGVSLCGVRGKAFASFLDSGNEVIIKTMGLLMKIAPLGLGCYFADTIATVGGSLLEGYLRVFLLFWALTVISVLVIYPSIIRLCRGKGSVKAWFINILPPSLTAMATTSSSVALPENIRAAEGLGIKPEIAETVIPVGTNMLKAGSVTGAVIKIAFLMALCGNGYIGFEQFFVTVGFAIVAAVVTGAVAGGNVTGELLICSLLGIDPKMAGLIIIIGTIIDIPCTLINSQATVVAAALVDRRKSRLL